VFVIHNILFFISPCPSHLCNSWTQLESSFIFTKKNDCCTSDSSVFHYAAFSQECFRRPCIYLSFRYSAVYFLEHHTSFGYGNFIKVVNRCIRYNLCRPIRFAEHRFIKNCAHAFSSHFYERILYSLPCLIMSKYGPFG